ncbi:hypothetical protein [Actinoplanes sp. NPDC051851]|uniref:hypothetical protein n=1 Tax=Actinoplanes sp. NPDC051851 TaxID=3154753 RepID=UPI0034363B87
MTERQRISRLLDEAVEQEGFVADHPARRYVDQRALRAVERAAAAVRQVAAEPVRVGLAGEFTTGKSVLISVLLGRPDLLPAKRRATTGVITEIRPRLTGTPGPDVDAEVHYLDSGAVAAYRERLVEELAAEAARRGLAKPDTGDWDALTAWCRDTLWPVHGMQDTIRELIALRDAVRVHGRVIGSPPQRAGWETVREHLLTIAGDSGGEPAWAGPPPGAGAPVSRLVDRVVLTVEVHPANWPLDRDRLGDDVVLLDTPGRGAAPTRVRDAMLLEREFPRLDALVLLSQPIKPDSAAIGEIRRDFSRAGGRHEIAVVNMFDQLTTWATDLESGFGPLTENDLIGHADHEDLHAAWQTAVGGGDGDRVALTSVVTAWALRPSGPPPVPLPQGIDEAGWRTMLCRGASAWRAIASRVEPQTGVATALTEFGADGGLGRLRRLITEQAARNGLDRKSERLRQRVAELTALVEQVRGQLVGWQATAADDHDRQRQELRQLLRGTARAELRRTRDRCEVEVLSTRFTMADGRTGLAVVRAQALEAVFAWPIWDVLQGSVIAEEQRVRLEVADVPRITDELLEPFEETVEAVRARAVATADAMVGHWLDRRNTELAPHLDEARRVIAGFVDRLGDGHQEVRVWWSRALQAKWLKKLGAAMSAPDQPKPHELFPLRAGVPLPWALPDRHQQHQIQIARVRHECALAAERAACTALYLRLESRTQAIREALDPMIKVPRVDDFLLTAYPMDLTPPPPETHDDLDDDGVLL